MNNSHRSPDECWLLLKTGRIMNALKEDLCFDPTPCRWHYGKFVYLIPKSEIAEVQMRIPDDIRRVYVAWDQADWALQAYACMNNRWNGFLLPKLERAEVEKLVKICNAEGEKWTFDGRTLRIVHSDPDMETIEIEPEQMLWEGREVTVWNMACCGYTWTETGGPFHPVNKFDLAAAFSRKLREWLSAEDIRDANHKNEWERNPSVCHSHDYCDANLAMQAAFMEFGIEAASAEFLNNTEATGLWSDAWDIAKQHQFDPELIGYAKRQADQ